MLKTISDAGLNKIKKAVKDLPLEKKIDVLTMLEEELFATRFKSLLSEFRESGEKYPITIEEITREVEAVRENRYESRN
ncbi:MAG: hypothetical protein COW04_01585 [Deltaproteobacteria bacterium CG12_big_fil_rev_8_21_14_0_65_43_10]|nr:MAG: hypothetical protein AUK23_08490 [Deltaproteobacteria bacterium CG2_30_43_15]PIQ46548.1 MAG: hypothetical protein COW04_01585 [Deltaproteobacteria bacterium CG12_big_fil_rev_8_21_14_0_65_43_10]PIU86260.1 MAG: hypothetical protein COS67_03475 [Deltaproteobacteria bacterium CG06_land_8_20_14_3_00_44_19]PIZ20807.1 MAG: hypothetical protein COY50_02830 [Deltaproteobacteria bacterium CG_4_10_14_0_8_um_filter_43_12]PJB44905.1 MAG: hypothetical protein CO106_02545 [Deltaproteobacteria bacteriu